MESHLAPAARQLDRIKRLCAQVGIGYGTPPDSVAAVGIAIGFGEQGYMLCSVLGGPEPRQLLMTSGVLCDIKRDRLPALEAANYFNHANTAYPVFLHDADVAWDLILQVTLPIQILIDVPDMFLSYVRRCAMTATEYRAMIPTKWDLGGRPWRWDHDDVEALLLRSTV